MRIGRVFGIFAASYFIVLRIGGFLGFLGFLLLHTLSFCELVRFLGFLGFLLLHTLSFLELVGFWGFWGFCCFILYRFKNRWVFGVFGIFAASYFVVL